jgi:hypothetical protein
MKTNIKNFGNRFEALVFSVELEVAGYLVEVTESFVIWRQ